MFGRTAKAAMIHGCLLGLVAASLVAFGLASVAHASLVSCTDDLNKCVTSGGLCTDTSADKMCNSSNSSCTCKQANLGCACQRYDNE